jgi:hypothetical protein
MTAAKKGARKTAPKTSEPDPFDTTPPPPEVTNGFVLMTHEDIGAVAEVPFDAVALHRLRGWSVADPNTLADEAATDTEQDQ